MSRLREKLADIVGTLSVNNVNSWWAHAAQGVLFTAVIGWPCGLLFGPPGVLIGVAFSEGAFFHREADGFLQDFLRDGLGIAWSNAREDGMMDLMAPHVSSFATALLLLAIL